MVVDMHDDVQNLYRNIAASDGDDVGVQRACSSRAAAKLISAVARPADAEGGPALEREKDCSMARASQLVGRSTIKATERDHAGNRDRAATSSNRVRTWRRQVAQYVAARSRARFLHIDGAKRRLKYISQLSWKSFFARATMTPRRGVGGSLNREFLNLHSKEHRGRLSAGEFTAKRREWAVEYDQLGDEGVLAQVRQSFDET